MVSVEHLDLEKVKCWFSEKLISTLTANIIQWKPFLINNFFILNVFEVNESIFRCFSKQPCSSDLEKPGQLPVLQKLVGTDDWVLWIFVSSSFPTYSESRNSFLAVSVRDSAIVT